MVKDWLHESSMNNFKTRYMTDDEWNDWLNKNWNFTGKIAANSFILEYRFQLPKLARDRRSKDPFKTVKREYLIITWISLVGTVGGTLGMFVGFSFLGLSESTLNVAGNVYRWLRMKKSVWDQNSLISRKVDRNLP